MTQPQIYLLPFSHLDLGFLGDREQALSRGNRIISAALDIMRDHPEFRFLLEDMVFVDDYLEAHPERAEELRAQVRAGRMEVGAKWAGIFQNLQEGEDLVRNLVYGKQFVRQHFGTEPDTVHLGDLPGYTPQYPQILAKGGVKGMIICRGGPADQVLYYWQSPDGSRALTWNALKSYVWSWRTRFHHTVDEALANGQEEQAREIMALTPAPILMHWGIDLVVPPEVLVDNLREWNERTPLAMQFATSSEYFDVAASVEGVPALTGEIPSVWCLVEPGGPDMRTMNGPASYALLSGELWSELARRVGFTGFPQDRITEAWKIHLQGMDHNGGGGFLGHDRNREYQVMGRLIGEEAARVALRQIIESIKVPDIPDITPLVVFNPTSWKRTEAVTACVAFHGPVEAFYAPGWWFDDHYKNVKLYDHTGQEVPFQYVEQRTMVTREAKITFTACDVPSFGYKLYYLLPVEREEPAQPCYQVSGTGWEEDLVAEGDRFRLEIKGPTGIVNLQDKVLGRAAAGISLQAEELMPFKKWFDHRPTGRLISNVVESVTVAENGPVRARIVIEGRIGQNPTRQEWILYHDMDYVDVVDHVTWEHHPSPILVQRVIPSGIAEPHVTYGVPFGANDWDNKQSNTGPHLRDEYSADVVERFREVLYWADVSASDGGLTVAMDRRVIERDGGTLKIALMIAGGRHSQFQQVALGNNHFSVRTRLRFHSGDWRASRAYRAGLALQMPMVGLSEHDPVTPKRLEPEASLCEGLPDNVVVTAIKRAETGEATVLRGYEASGQTVEGTPKLAGAACQVSEVDLMEEQPKPVSRVTWRPYEIKTLRFE